MCYGGYQSTNQPPEQCDAVSSTPTTIASRQYEAFFFAPTI